MYKNILFDLDGTLTDSRLGIVNSVAYALNKYGITVEDLSELDKFIGPPLVTSFMGYYGFSGMQAEEAVGFYREYFKDKGIYENEVYEGAIPMLEAVRASGKRIMLATSKPEVFAIKVLEYFDLKKYFDCVTGASLDGSVSHKVDVITLALERAGISGEALGETIMIGDRKHDIEGATANALDSVGVLYGYGSEEELVTAGATYIADSPLAIVSIVG